MKQFTWQQAEEIAARAADKARGFSPATGPVPKGTTCEDVLRVAHNAAVIALRLAGALDQNDLADRTANERAATAAERRHRDWCKATGNKF